MPSHRRCLAIAAALGLGAARAVVAQCPDGSPPPCARPAAARSAAAPALDPNLVAILPFRVTTSDTLLGEGFAELLATQFTGEGSPRAVDMATTLSAWRRAGGGLRAPLPRARAVQLGRELGAGLVSEGSIVGLGSRVTVSASLVAVPGGEVRGSAQPISGPVDSLDALLRRTTTGLLAAVGGQAREAEGTRFTESPTAMRAYLEGLAAWRRGRLEEAAAAFDRAIARDSSFAQARFRRYLAANWGVAGAGAPYGRLAWERREGLSQREHATLETLLGPLYPAPRSFEARFAARQALTERYPDSPDAWYFLGDLYFHFGRPVAPTQYVDIARTAFERSAAIDSQATLLNHLVWIGILKQDTALLRRTLPGLDRTDDATRWLMGWLAAATTGDNARLAALRRRPVDFATDPGAIQGAFVALGAAIPPALLDEMFERWASAIPPEDLRAAIRFWHGVALVVSGRPAAAEHVWAALPEAASHLADEQRLTFDLWGEGAGLDVAGAARRLSDAAGRGALAGDRPACVLALWRRDHGDGDAGPVDTARFRSSQPRCARSLEASSLGRSRDADAEARLAAVDSVQHQAFTSTTGAEQFEGPVLARAWERRGNARRAVAAVRHNVAGESAVRMEGRLAALAADTAGAVHAWRRWLHLTANAEPILQPARDSVRAEVARLTGRD